MARPRILVTRPITEDALALLRAEADVSVGPADREASRQELQALGRRAARLAGERAHRAGHQPDAEREPVLARQVAGALQLRDDSSVGA